MIAQASVTPPTAYGMGGMPTSRRQLFDENLIPEESETISNQNFKRMDPQQQMPYSPQYNMRMSSNSTSSFIRPSSRSSSRASPQLSLKGSLTKNINHNDDNFDTNSMNSDSYSLQDRDRYPNMGGSPDRPLTNRAILMTNSFDTAPIIPTFGQFTNREYRKNLTASRNQLMNSDGTFPQSFLANPSQVNQNFHQFPGGPPHPPMSSQDPMQMRTMSNLGLGSGGMPQDPKYSHNYPKPLASAGRSMSMGGFSRPPPNIMSPIHGPGGGPGGSLMQSSMGGPVHNMKGPLAGPPSIPLNGSSFPQNKSNYNRSSLPTNNNNNSTITPASNESRSRSSSKSSSPSPASNSMSRPNSQALSSYSSPENLSLSSTTPVSKSIALNTNSVMTDIIPTTNRSISPIPVEPLVASSNISTSTRALVPTSDRSISPIPVEPMVVSAEPSAPTKNLDLIDRAISPILDTSVASANSPQSQTIQVPADTLNLIDDLKRRNISLLDEIRLVTSELADAIRREIGISHIQKQPITDVDQLTMNHQERALLLVSLQNELDQERRKRLLIEDKLHAVNNCIEVEPLYNSVSLESRLAANERNLLAKTIEHENINSTLEDLRQKHTLLQDESNKLKSSVVPELEAQVTELKLASDPTELLETIEELKLENKKLALTVEENKNKLVSSDKIKDIESQRDALRDALRSLRERKDHEIKQYAEKVRVLDLKLEKERVISAQFQRKFANNYRSISGPSLSILSPAPLHHDSVHLTLPADSNTSPAPLSPLSPISLTHQRAVSPSPTLEISHEPSWVDPGHDLIMPGKFSHNSRPSINSLYSIKGNINLSSPSLSLPKGRTEQIPLSLGSHH